MHHSKEQQTRTTDVHEQESEVAGGKMSIRSRHPRKDDLSVSRAPGRGEERWAGIRRPTLLLRGCIHYMYIQRIKSIMITKLWKLGKSGRSHSNRLPVRRKPDPSEIHIVIRLWRLPYRQTISWSVQLSAPFGIISLFRRPLGDKTKIVVNWVTPDSNL